MIYDITQELFGSLTYPGDTTPERIVVRRMEDGELYNLSDIKMCAHNGTHVDAPRHFVRDGKSIDEMDLNACIGTCQVCSDIAALLSTESERVLLRGMKELDEDIAQKLLSKNIKLLGIEGQSIGSASVHHMLLSHEIVLLEGIRLDGVADGTYFLFAAPMKLGNCDGAPCRAILLDDVN
ncbi:MAG: cyclase family protein [Clostridia bacterium]|nr:cyclase family protein [Clostridia bacterium]